MYNPNGFLLTILIFQSAMVMGSLGFAAFFPYDGLVGCSPGIYGLIGANIMAWVLMREVYDNFFIIAMPFSIFVYLLMDVVFYFVDYSNHTGYMSHFSGLLTGILLYPVFIYYFTTNENHKTLLERRKWVHYSVAAVFGGIFICFFLALVLNIVSDHLPPRVLIRSEAYFHNTEPDCCDEYFHYQSDHPQYSKEQVLSNSACNSATKSFVVYLP
jgi:uncharacterized membrane-anchored protein YitT (DUF2179 family)